MFGGTGSDSYYVDSVSDYVEDVSDSGYDRVYATSNFTLGGFIEGLHLSGRSNQSGTGNDLGNEIFGNDYANSISGLAGTLLTAGAATTR
jgi:hypothetical protein